MGMNADNCICFFIKCRKHAIQVFISNILIGAVLAVVIDRIKNQMKLPTGIRKYKYPFCSFSG